VCAVDSVHTVKIGTCTHTHTRMHTHIQTHACKHTHTHMHTHTRDAAAEEQEGRPSGLPPNSQGAVDAFTLSESAISEGLPAPPSPQAQEKEEQQQQPQPLPTSASQITQPGLQTSDSEAPGALAKQQSEIAAPTVSSSGSSKSGRGSEASSKASTRLSDYSMSFDGVENEEYEVDAATSGRAPVDAAGAEPPQPPSPSSAEIAEQITQDTMRRVFSDSVEVRCSILLVC